MGDLETVKVKSPNSRTGYMIINKSDFDDDQKGSKKHKLVEVKGGEDQEQALGVEMTDKGQKNPSGTFSEPTPTDIRYPDKTKTEFENNFGAHVGKSAAQMRKKMGLPDKPGGLHPTDDIDIPEDWKGLPVKERKALAQSLGGDEDMTAKDANALIQDEVDRREAIRVEEEGENE